jgi:hypothetical protein
VFGELLPPEDARRATAVVDAILGHGLRCALTGGLAIRAQLRRHGRVAVRRPLNDIDLVVEGFAAIPESLAHAFLQHHVHPDAAEGKTLLQLIDRPHALRVDLFRAFGGTLSRASTLDRDTGPLAVLSVEDLVARTTAFVAGHLRRGATVDVKHATGFASLRGLGRPDALATAWHDHRQQVAGTLEEAAREAERALAAHPELVVDEPYSTQPATCERCRAHGSFRPAPAERILEILGYC